MTATADAEAAVAVAARPHMTVAMVATLVAVAVIWGLNFAVIKTGIRLVPPIAFVALRFAAVGLCLLPWLRWPGRRMADLVALSVVLGVVHFSLMFTGMKALDVATASIAIQLQVPFAAILAAFFFGEKLRWRRITGMAIAFAGVVMIAGEPRLAGNLPSLFMVVGAACTWAAANIQIKRIGDEVDVLALNGWVSLLAAPQLMALSWAVEDGQLAAIAAADWRLWAGLAFQVLLVTIFGYAVWYRMMRQFSVNQVMPFTLLVPVFGVLSGVVVFDERLTPLMIAGGLCTIVGVAIIIIRRPRVIAPSTKAGL